MPLIDVFPVSINAAGQVVGFGGSGYLYSGGKMTNLDAFIGAQIRPFGINNAGQIVGRKDENQAFLYSGGKITGLGTLGGGYSSAYGINNAGYIVGTSYMKNSTTPHAFLFTNGRMTDLNSLINHTPDFILTSANAINNRGQILTTGIYTNNPNSYGSYLLTPTNTLDTPEPGSLTLLALGALGLGGHAWRTRRRDRLTRSAPCTAAALALKQAKAPGTEGWLRPCSR